MKSGKYFIIIIVLMMTFSTEVFSQTPGLIFDPATGGGSAVLDPNGDGYVSPSTAGWTRYSPPSAPIDETASEISFVSIPPLYIEPSGDIERGPSCGFGDLVGTAGNPSPALYTLNGTNLLFRFRLGGAAPNSKGYTILIDTDNKFGGSGADADPNYIAGSNPGFEIEISLQTNFGVYVYNVDGVASAGTPVQSYNGHTNYQKSIAASQFCGDDDFFYDMYIPMSALASLGVTATTPIRMAYITTMNPQATIGNNAIADVGGIDDRLFSSFEDLVTEIINNYTPTCLQSSICGTPLLRSACPTINPVLASATSVSGTSSEATGTTIIVYKNGSPVCTTTVSSGTWTCTGLTFSNGDIIKATAKATGKGTSVDNCSVTTVTGTCTDPVSAALVAECTPKKGFTGSAGSAISGAVIRVYDSGGNLLTPNAGTVFGAGSITAAADGSWVWKCNGSAACSAGANNCITDGGYYITQQSGTQCESVPIWICTTGGTQATAPTISTNPIYATTTSISGTSPSGAHIYLYADGVQIRTGVATGTNWILTGLSLTAGQVITAKAVTAGLCLSAASIGITVSQQSTPPLITNSFCTNSNLTTVTGTSIEASGTIIKLYLNGTYSGNSTTVNSSGAWSITGLNIAAGVTVSATATNSPELESQLSTVYTVTTAPSNTGLTVNSPIAEGATSVSGTGSGGTVKLYVDGFVVGTATISGGIWTVSGLTSTVITAGASVYATYAPGGACESSPSNAVLIACTQPQISLAVSPASTSLCTGTYIHNVTISSSESGVIYSLYTGGSQTGSSRIGTGGSITLTAAPLTSSATFTINALKITPSACGNDLSNSSTVTVNARPDSLMTVSDHTICSGETQSISLASSQSGVNYTLRNSADNSVVAGPVSGTGSAITFSVSPSATTTYNVLATFASTGCTSTLTDNAVITVNGTLPSITSTTPNSRCDAGTVSLSASATAGTLVWYSSASGGSSLGTGTTFNTPSISSTTVYYVEANSGGCISTRTAVTATVNTTPSVTSTTPSSRCDAGSVSLAATSSTGTLNWYAAASGGSSLGTGTTFTTPSLSSTTTYYVDATATGCTTARTAVTATVNTTPSVTSTTPDSRCDAGTVTLAATASAGTLNWYSAASGGSSLGTGTSFLTPSISSTSTYYVEATATGCTSARTAVTATVNTTPIVTSTTPNSRCDAGTVTLAAATSAGTLNWYAAASGGSSLGTGSSFTTPSISSTTTYYVDATATGCTTARTAVTATVNTTPSVTSTTPDSRCDAGTVTLAAATSAGTLNWYTAASGGTPLGSGTTFTTPSISSTTTYYVGATATGCNSARTAVTATVNTTPSVTSTTPVSRCDAGTVSLAATTSAGTLNWYAAASGGSSLGTGTTFTTPSISSTTIYYVDATATGCTSARTAVTATVNTTPTVTSTTPASICDGGSLTLNATSSAGTIDWFNVATGGSSLSTGATYTTPSISATTTYYVEASETGCTSARTAVTATVYTTPLITSTSPAARCDAGDITISSSASSGVISWYSDPSATNLISTGNSLTITSLDTTATLYAIASENGCASAAASVIATITNTPSIDSTVPDSRCTPGVMHLQAIPSSGNIEWYSDTTNASVFIGNNFTTPFLSASTDYFIRAELNGCPSAFSALTAFVDPGIDILSVTDGSRCDNGTVSLAATASSGIIYWYADSTTTTVLGTGSTFLTPSINGTTTFYTQASNTGCSSARYPVIATVQATPNVSSTSPAARCDAGTVSLSATVSAGSVIWFTDSTTNTIISTGANFTTPVITASQTYYVAAEENGCISSRQAVNATVNTTPSVINAASVSRCDSGSVTLTATSSAGTINWYDSTTGGTLLSTGNSYTTSINQAVTLYAEALDSGCASARTAINADIISTPVIASVNSTARCDAGSVTISAIISSGQAQWYDAPTGGTLLNTGTTFSTNISQSTVYYVEGIDSNCISSRIPVTATVITTPVVISTNSSSVCDSGAVTLTATASSGTINWYATGTSTQILGTGSTYTTPVISIPQQYFVEVTDSICSSARVAVFSIINQTPVITFTSSASRCDAGTVTISVSVSSGNVSWFDQISGGTSLANGQSFSPTIASNTTYYAEVENAGCISQRVPVTATVNSTPSVLTVTPASRCSNGTVDLTATVSSGTINWYADASSTAIIGSGNLFTTPVLSNTTDFYVEVTDNNCTSVRSMVTATIENPTAAFAGNDDNVNCSSRNLILNGNNPSIGETASWSILSGQDGSFNDIYNPAATFTGTVGEVYNLLWTISKNSCVTTDTVTITFNNCDPDPRTVEIPTAFSPNSDGFNDAFEIKNLLLFPNNSFQVFNRWGNLVFSREGYANNWLGENNSGDDLPEGTYFYILELRDSQNQKFNGYIHIARGK